MRTFSDELWKLRYPSEFLDSKDVDAVRQQYVTAFLIYQRLPRDLRKGEAWVVSTLIDPYKALGIDEHDSATMLVMVYWTEDANAYKLAFWMMSYILFDSKLYDSIRNETLGAFQNRDVDLNYLANNCPADVFGSDALAFRPDRFMRQEELIDSPSFRPHGGGKTYCPGRFFAMQEIFGFEALQIHRFDIQLASPGQSPPVPDGSLLTLGVSRPVPGSDVWVTLFDKRSKS